MLSLTNGHKPINHPYKNVKIHPSLLWNEYTDLNTNVEINFLKKSILTMDPLAATLRFLHISTWWGWHCWELFVSFFKNAGCRLDMPPNLLIRTYFHRGSAWEEVYIGRAIMYPWRSEREVEPSEKGREHSCYVDFFLKEFSQSRDCLQLNCFTQCPISLFSTAPDKGKNPEKGPCHPKIQPPIIWQLCELGQVPHYL